MTRLTMLSGVLLAFFTAGQAAAEDIEWESLGRKDDYEISWAKNIKVPTNTVGGYKMIGTMIRFNYDQPDHAPNNARFDNEQLVIGLRCDTREYMALQKTYNMGNRRVLSQSPNSHGFSPYVGTFVEKVAERVCQ